MQECLERWRFLLGRGALEPAAYDGRIPRPFLITQSDPWTTIGVGGERGSLLVGLSTVESLMASAFSFLGSSLRYLYPVRVVSGTPACESFLFPGGEGKAEVLSCRLVRALPVRTFLSLSPEQIRNSLREYHDPGFAWIK